MNREKLEQAKGLDERLKGIKRDIAFLKQKADFEMTFSFDNANSIGILFDSKLFDEIKQWSLDDKMIPTDVF